MNILLGKSRVKPDRDGPITNGQNTSRIPWHSATWKDYPKTVNGAGGDSPSVVAGYVERLSVAVNGGGGIVFPV